MSVIREDYVAQAEEVMGVLLGKNATQLHAVKPGGHVKPGGPAKTAGRNHQPGKAITTSQLRNILATTAHLLDEAEFGTGPLEQKTIDKVQYLRVRVLYQAGREASVEEFVNKAKLLPALADIGESREKLIKFGRYMEALVAFHKYLGGRD